ncbi:hypothetical protein [Paenibacillus sp. JDR-2]|uniref:hypothetical protein n=1 Tax=Paenibacillus sp. (strain JDR-2) TaxID=324057 RepID=UPI000166AC33|nr:hypothetical protein [Paenibacillus sp. JDR-2]ACT04833.1 hypothetical protein Pjdr2_6230 [Paenibacillus sp. JDR-2]
MHKSVNVKIHGAIILFSFLIFFPVGIILLIIRYALHAKYNYLREKDDRLAGHSFLTLFGLVMLMCMLAGVSGDGLLVSFIGFFIFLGIPAILFYAVASSRKKKMDKLYMAYYHLVIEQGNTSIAVLSQSTGVPVQKVSEDIRYMIVTDRLPGASMTSMGDITLSKTSMTDSWNTVEAGVKTNRTNNNGDIVLPGMTIKSMASGGDIELPGMTIKGMANGGGIVLPGMTINSSTTSSEIEINIEIGDDGIGTAQQAAAAKASDDGPKSVVCSGCGANVNLYPGKSQECEFCGNVINGS